MKAAVIHSIGTTPQYEDFSVPVAQNGQQLLMQVKATSLKNLDKSRASGAHYSTYASFLAVVGTDGVGILPDGTAVYANGITGMMAEYALVDRRSCTPLPAGLDFALAAAIPNAVVGAGLALKYRAGMAPGKHVLINGATGFTGKAAVQIARHMGASKITVTGRNEARLTQLKSLGADAAISLSLPDEEILEALKKVHRDCPIDIVLDYLWGNPVALIIRALRGEGLHSIANPVRLVTIGEMAGKDLTLSSGVLRSAPIEICGSGFGSLPQEALDGFRDNLLPEMYELAANGGLQADIIKVPATGISDVWNAATGSGERIVLLW